MLSTGPAPGLHSEMSLVDVSLAILAAVMAPGRAEAGLRKAGTQDHHDATAIHFLSQSPHPPGHGLESLAVGCLTDLEQLAGTSAGD